MFPSNPIQQGKRAKELRQRDRDLGKYGSRSLPLMDSIVSKTRKEQHFDEIAIGVFSCEIPDTEISENTDRFYNHTVASISSGDQNR
ncbi:MAG: hypothetical protein AB4290_17475 [Spirulina sp.]